MEVDPGEALVEEALRGKKEGKEKRVVKGEKGGREKKVEKVKKAEMVEVALAAVTVVEVLAQEVRALGELVPVELELAAAVASGVPVGLALGELAVEEQVQVVLAQEENLLAVPEVKMAKKTGFKTGLVVVRLEAKTKEALEEVPLEAAEMEVKVKAGVLVANSKAVPWEVPSEAAALEVREDNKVALEVVLKVEA